MMRGRGNIIRNIFIQDTCKMLAMLLIQNYYEFL